MFSSIAGDELPQISRELPSQKSKSKRPRSKPLAKAKNQEIAFVNLTGSSGPIQDAEKRKTVRIHVMRAYQRKKLQEDNRNGQSSQYRLVDPPSTFPPIALQEISDKDTVSSQDAVAPSVPESWNATVGGRVTSQSQRHKSIVAQQEEDEWVLSDYLDRDQAAAPVVMTQAHQPANTVMTGTKQGGPISFNNSFNLTSPTKVGQAGGYPRQSKWPLSSQSLVLELSFNALNSGRLDPFNAMPGLRNARAQALMHHCKLYLLIPSLQFYLHHLRQQGPGQHAHPGKPKRQMV